jgi:hypothetical protein
MLASTLGIEFDEEKSWDEKKECGRSAGRSTDPSTSPSRRSRDEYTTVLAAAVLVI